MPQLSHQYHCVNDANCYAHWTIVQGLQYQYKYASVGAVIVHNWWFLLCEKRCNERLSLATCQETTQLVEQRSHLTCNLIFSPLFLSLCLSHFLRQRVVTSLSHLFGLFSSSKQRFTSEAPHPLQCTIGALPLVWVHCRCSAQPPSCPAVLGPISTWFITLKYHCTN